MNDAKDLLGKKVKYYDYLGVERYGKIIIIEPYNQDPTAVWVYIEDEDPDYNIHNFVRNDASVIRYADLRPSFEVVIED